MLGRHYDGQDCSAARALESVGERWTLLILRDAMFRGYTRFSDFQRSLGVASNVLGKRLETLVADGIMQTVSTSGHPEYTLTAKGRDLMPVIIALTEWGDKWVTPGPVDFRHKDCDGIVELRLHCDGCEAVVTVDEVRAARRQG